jgi:hypothetical protein
MPKEKPMPTVYGLYINLDERGSFNADVRDLNDKTIFQVIDDDAFEMSEQGLIRDLHSPDDYEDYMRDVGLIPKGGHVYDMGKFERLQERYLEMKNDNQVVEDEEDLSM